MFVIVERNAHVMAGHEHSQLAAIRAMVPKVPCELLQAKETDGAANAILSSDRSIRHSADDALRQDIAALAIWVSAKGESEVVIIVPNANAYEVRLALALIEAVESKPVFVLRLLRPEDIGSLDAMELDLVRRAKAAGNLQFHTETIELTAYLHSVYDLEAPDNFLLPCTLSPTDHLQPSARHDDGEYHVGFLGVPRSEKGRNLMPEILRSVSDLVRDGGQPVRFIMQRAPRSSLRLAPYLYEARCNWAVRRCSKVSISWQDAGLSDEAFRQIFADLDLLLLPYKRGAYAQRGSGMIVDAVLAGVPVLHTRGLAMKHLLEFTGAAAETPQEFADHITRLSTSDAVDQHQLAKARDFLIEQFERTRKLLVSLVDGQAGQAAN
ncbi:MAG: hypothetical protein AAF601_03480 [Pseudomonadota bacterium]